MKVVVYPHDLAMGGSQLNAIEIAAGVRDLGVETVVFGRPGALVDRIHALGLEFVESPNPGRRPSRRVMTALRDLVRDRGIDIVHGYEWPPALESAWAATGSRHVTAVATVMSMAVAPFIPHTIPLLVGTQQIAAAERGSGRRRIGVLEPPVDLSHNVRSSPPEVAAFRHRWGLDDSRPKIVCVTRLAAQLKSEGLFSAIAAACELTSSDPIQLVVVGDGPARAEVAAAAEEANARCGPGTVVLTGEMFDPRPAYSAADVVIGMGGSALRALAFEVPLIVQGEGGFFRLLTRESLPEFLWQGWYGVGQSRSRGTGNLVRILTDLLPQDVLRAELGRFGHQVVTDRFSLDRAAERQVGFYAAATREAPGGRERLTSSVSSSARFAGYHARRRLRRLTGQRAHDDFNARPVARSGPTAPPSASGQAPTAPGALVYFSGAPWDAVSGTDLNLAKALAAHRPVVWVDPPVSIVSRLKRNITTPPVSVVAPGVTRLHPIAPPGVTRPGMRAISGWWAVSLVRRYLRRSGQQVTAVLASSPEPVLAHWAKSSAHRIYFATDDFVAGAELLGMAPKRARRSRESNLLFADSVLAVSESLAETLGRRGRQAVVFPNGCNVDLYAAIDSTEIASEVELSSPIAGVIGQLNERLDLSCLEAVADAGINLLLVGPRYEQDAATSRRMDELIKRDAVQWVDRQPTDRLPAFMAAIDVGLTPYADTAFNRASFPLKTLEYVAAGRPVVSTALPSAAGLNTPFVVLAHSAEEFGCAVRQTVAQQNSADATEQRRRFARQHSWQARAREFEKILAAALLEGQP